MRTMMSIIRAQFDGRVFVPTEAVTLPPGTKVEVLIPGASGKLTPEQMKEWQEILRAIDATEPEFPTVEEAMRHSRKRP